MRSRENSLPRWYRSSAAAVMTALCGYGLFGLLFHIRMPEAQPVEHRAGKITLLPMKPEDRVLQSWMRIHDPAVVVRGEKMPEIPAYSLPANAPRPEPVILPESPRVIEPSKQITLQMTDAGNVRIPEMRRREKLPVFPEIPPENYPRLTLNRKRFSGSLPPELLRRAAAAKAGTAEFRITAGLLPEELRVAVIRSSGNTGIDREIAGCITAWKIPELPADFRIVWDAAGELEK